MLLLLVAIDIDIDIFLLLLLSSFLDLDLVNIPLSTNSHTYNSSRASQCSLHIPNCYYLVTCGLSLSLNKQKQHCQHCD
eukprot:Awhi_evm1s10685